MKCEQRDVSQIRDAAPREFWSCALPPRAAFERACCERIGARPNDVRRRRRDDTCGRARSAPTCDSSNTQQLRAMAELRGYLPRATNYAPKEWQSARSRVDDSYAGGIRQPMAEGRPFITYDIFVDVIGIASSRVDRARRGPLAAALKARPVRSRPPCGRAAGASSGQRGSPRPLLLSRDDFVVANVRQPQPPARALGRSPGVPREGSAAATGGVMRAIQLNSRRRHAAATVAVASGIPREPGGTGSCAEARLRGTCAAGRQTCTAAVNSRPVTYRRRLQSRVTSETATWGGRPR